MYNRWRLCDRLVLHILLVCYFLLIYLFFWLFCSVSLSLFFIYSFLLLYCSTANKVEYINTLATRRRRRWSARAYPACTARRCSLSFCELLAARQSADTRRWLYGNMGITASLDLWRLGSGVYDGDSRDRWRMAWRDRTMPHRNNVQPMNW